MPASQPSASALSERATLSERAERPADRPLSERAFIKLTRELTQILEAAQTASSSEKTAGYWRLGQRITAERLSEEAGYHNTILREVAAALGISQRTLQHAVLFHAVYPTLPSAELSWAHYRLLAPLPTKKERTFYSKRSVKEGWTVRELKAAIHADLFAGGEVAEPIIERPTDSAYVYLGEAPRLVDADTLDLEIDLGFHTWTRKRLRLARIDAPEAGTKEGRAAKNFVLTEISRARTIAVKTHKVDLHGRYIADVFLSPHEVELDECYQQGRYLNDLMVQAGHAQAAYP